MRKLCAGLMATAAMLFSSPGSAQDADLFDKLDTNKDGFLTADEAGEGEKKRIFEQLLRRADKNGDGKLSREEFTAGTTPKPDEPDRSAERPAGERPPPGADLRALFERFDANSDGKLSKEEVPDFLKERFDRIDANRDGFADKEEMARALGQFGGRPAAPGRGGEDILARFDKNGDGKLSKDEAPEPLQGIFDRADANKDGFLDKEELAGAFAQRGSEPARPQPAPGDLPLRPFPGAVVLRALDANGDGELSADEIANAPKVLAALDKNGDGKLSPEELAPQPMPARPGAAQNAQALFERIKQADANGDGKLSKDEAPPFLRERFEQLDANKDGFLDKEELQAVLPRLQERVRPEGRPEREEAEPKKP